MNNINVDNADDSKKDDAAMWQQCYDDSTGCWYHWNVKTNEVSWEMPTKLSNQSNRKPAEDVNGEMDCEEKLNAINNDEKLSTLVGYNSSDVSDQEDECEIHSKENDARPKEIKDDVTSTLPGLVDFSSDSDDESDEKTDLNVNDEEEFSGAFHWMKSAANIESEQHSANNCDEASESSKDKFRRAIAETYGDIPPAPALKRPKLISFIKSDEALIDANKEIAADETSSLSSDVSDPDADATSKEMEIGLAEENNDGIDEIDAALERALKEHKQSLDSATNTTDEQVQPQPPIDAAVQPSPPELTEEEKLRCKAEEAFNKLSAMASQFPFSFVIYTLLVEIQTRSKDWISKFLDTDYYEKCVEISLNEIKRLEHELTIVSWSFHWDRKYKMYYFKTDDGKVVQWEYPADDVDKDDQLPQDKHPDRPPLPSVPEENPPLPKSPPPPLPDPVDSLSAPDSPSLTDENQHQSGLLQTHEAPIDKDANSLDAEPLKPVFAKKRRKLKEDLSLKKKGMSSLLKKWEKLNE